MSINSGTRRDRVWRLRSRNAYLCGSRLSWRGFDCGDPPADFVATYLGRQKQVRLECEQHSRLPRLPYFGRYGAGRVTTSGCSISRPTRPNSIWSKTSGSSSATTISAIVSRRLWTRVVSLGSRTRRELDRGNVADCPYRDGLLVAGLEVGAAAWTSMMLPPASAPSITSNPFIPKACPAAGINDLADDPAS
jgi:hypothetical protein